MKPSLLFFTLFSLAILGSCTSDSGKAKEGKEVKTSVQHKEVDSVPAKTPFNKDIQLYTLDVTLEEDNETVESIYVSLSDNYPLSENPDSLAVPLHGDETDTLESMYLKGKYRKQFLNTLKLKDDDKLFLYDYGNDLLLSFPIKSLKTIAWLNPYESISDRPYQDRAYMIGFELDKKLAKKFTNIYGGEVLVAFGQESPFVQGKMKMMSWKKQTNGEWPKAVSRLKRNNFKDFKALDSPYSSKYDTLTFWIQYWKHEKEDWNQQSHLMVLGKSGKLVYETVYITDEGSALKSVRTKWGTYTGEEQWVGMLIKGGGPAFIGFTGNQFACPYFTFLHQPSDKVVLNCDCRH